MKYKVRCIHTKQTPFTLRMWRHLTTISSLLVTVLVSYVTDYLARSDTWTLLWGGRRNVENVTGNCKETNRRPSPLRMDTGGLESLRWKKRENEGRGGTPKETWKDKKSKEGRGKWRGGNTGWLNEGKERLAEKRGDWYENICDGFRGKSARWARSTCCSPLHSLLFPLSAPHLAELFLTDSVCITMQKISDDLKLHCEIYMTMNIMTWRAVLAYRVWQSASVLLFLNLWCSRQRGCVPTRQTEGKTLLQ